MSSIMIEIPEEVIRTAKIPPGEISQRIKNELAARLYEKSILTFGKARLLAGLSKWQFYRFLGESGVVRNYDLEELDKDIEYLEDLD